MTNYILLFPTNTFMSIGNIVFKFIYLNYNNIKTMHSL